MWTGWEWAQKRGARVRAEQNVGQNSIRLPRVFLVGWPGAWAGEIGRVSNGEFRLRGRAAGGWRGVAALCGWVCRARCNSLSPVQSGYGGFSGLTLVISVADECPSCARRHTEISVLGAPDGSEQAL